MKFNPDWATRYVNEQLALHNIEVISWSKGDCGIAYIQTRQIKIPQPTTINRFLICLHEICHITRQSQHKTMKVYEYEWDCEMWAMQQAMNLRLDIEDYEHRARGWIMHCLCKAYNRGLNLDRANQEILDWLGVDINKWKKWDRAYVIAKTGWKKWKVDFYNK
jgi:hypothetical protein